MCGIVGIYGGRFDQLIVANNLLSHRGPDDHGVFLDNDSGVGLGHRRLSIVDLSPFGHQPMVSADGLVVLVFNGEIYNFLELRIKLQADGISFRGQSDTEVLLNLYLVEGEAMLGRLNGIFAFAIWDSRNKSLFLARDALGVKPLYYSALGQCFAFASEIKALMCLVPEARALDVVGLHRYISFLWCPGDGTPFKEVRKLGPGEAMLVRGGKIERCWQWYRLPSVRGVVGSLDKESAVAGVEFHLRQAVRRQMVADVPVGAFLSGGIDSSSVVAFAREENPDIQCFTIEAVGGQEKGVVDDLPYARMVAKHLGVSLNVVRFGADSLAVDLQRMVRQLDEPLADPAALSVFYISQLARSQGIKVLLSGTGGDDIFAGYRRHQALQAERYWDWMPHFLRNQLMSLSGSLMMSSTTSRRISKLLSGANLEGDARTLNYFRWIKEADLLKLYTPEARRQLGYELADQPMVDFLSQLSSGLDPLERMLALEQRFFMADHNLIYTDKMSMAAGVEVRVPFLDQDLVEFAAHVPSSLKQSGREGKWVLKQAMKSYLPHEVIYRSKSSFGAPIRRWMLNDLSGLLGDLLSVDSLQRRGLLDPNAVQGLIADNKEGRVDASYTLLSLLCIEIWCREFLD